MNADQLRTLQRPLKQRYLSDPAARVTLQARGRLDGDTVTCRVPTHAGQVTVGLHPATGGDGTEACSGHMLLEALVACAGVTLRAVATSIGFAMRGGTVTAEGELDFRGTLGVAKDAPVGFEAIRLTLDLETEEPPERVAKLVELAERYCVVLQTLRKPPAVTVKIGT
jgi:uncharacterized OsmC-like protein